MTPETWEVFFSQSLFGVVIKVSVLIILFLYSLFAAVVLRQVQIMNRVLVIANFSSVLFTITVLHLFISLGLLLLVLIFL